MQIALLIVCLILLVWSAVAVIMFRSMLKAAMSLAAASAILAVVLFLLEARVAALFELSVCSGLITVVFVSAISLTSHDRHDEAHMRSHRSRFKLLPYVLVGAGLLLVVALLVMGNFAPAGAGALSSSFAEFKQVFWNTRQADIVGQLALILAGAFAVVVLFKERDEHDDEPVGTAAGLSSDNSGGSPSDSGSSQGA